MDRFRRVISNTTISLLGQVVSWASTLLLTSAYGRFLGEVKLGELYFAITFVLLIGFPIEIGFNQQLTRSAAQEPDKALRYFSNALFIKGALWLVLYSLLLLFCWLLGYAVEVRILIAICGVTLLSTAVANTFAAIYYSFEKTVFSVVGSILEKGLSALIGIILLKYGAGVEVMAFVLMGGSLINLLWQASWFFRLVGTRFSLSWAVMRGLIQTGIPFLVYGILGVIYYRLDTILLSLMTSIAVVGWYGAAYRLFDTLLFLPSLLISSIMYPIFSKLSVSSEASLKVAIEKTTNFLLIGAFPIATIMIFAAPNIIGFLYHRAEFSQSIPVLQALAPGLIFLYMNSVLASIIVSTKREKKIVNMAAIALVFNLGLNLVLIPLYQHIGSAIVTSLTELLLLCISVVYTPRHLLPVGSLRVAAKALMASLVMALAIFLLQTFNIFLIVAIALPVYCGVVLLLKTIPRQDLQSFYTAVRQKSQRTAVTVLAAQQALEEIGDLEVTEKMHRIELEITEKRQRVRARKSVVPSEAP